MEFCFYLKKNIVFFVADPLPPPPPSSPLFILQNPLLVWPFNSTCFIYNNNTLNSRVLLESLNGLLKLQTVLKCDRIIINHRTGKGVPSVMSL